MKFKSAVFSQASGSLAGATFSRNKGGMYVRSRALVITPKTTQQLAVQNTLKVLTARWKTLSESIRAGWKTYAINTPILNALGESRVIPELSWYLKVNAQAYQDLGITGVIDAAPTTFGMATLTTPVLTATNPSTLSIAYTNTDAWATTTGGYLWFQQGRPIPTTHKFVKTRYRLVGHVAGNTSTPPTSPATPTAAFTFAASELIAVRCVARNADGRVSSPQVITVVSV